MRCQRRRVLPYPVAPCFGGISWWRWCGSGMVLDLTGGGVVTEMARSAPGDVVVGLPCNGSAGGRGVMLRQHVLILGGRAQASGARWWGSGGAQWPCN
jgi:hypothetical protein